jgi:hypothetical protein
MLLPSKPEPFEPPEAPNRTQIQDQKRHQKPCQNSNCARTKGNAPKGHVRHYSARNTNGPLSAATIMVCYSEL